MKQPFVYLFLLLTLLALSACNAAGNAEPTIESADNPPAEIISVDQCTEAAPGAHQLLYAAQGVCFLYPDTYDVFQGKDGSLSIYQRSLMNTEAPFASINFEPLKERSNIIAEYLPEVDLAVVTVLKNLPK